MIFFIYSSEGSGFAMAQLLQREGHEVIVHIKKERYEPVGNGMILKTQDPEYAAANADIIIFDDNGDGNVADRWRNKGYRVFGGGSILDRLEYDRVFGMKILAEHGITIPDTYEVSKINEIEDVLHSEFSPKDKCVVKIDGEDAAGSSFSYVASSTDDLIGQVTHWTEDGLLPKNWSGIVQRCVEGIEVSTEGIFNGDGWDSCHIDLEEKKCWPGNLGPSVGCAFNTVAEISHSSKLFKMVLEPMTPWLKKIGYRGHFDVNCIVTEDGVPNALEFTPRVGYDCCPTFFWGNSTGYGSSVASAVGFQNGPILRPDGPRGAFLSGVRLHIPPYPADVFPDELEQKVYKKAFGTPIEVPEGVTDDFLFYDATVDRDQLVCAGTVGIIGIALGAGESPQAAGKAAYRVAEKVRVPNKSYRWGDGYKRAEEQIPELIRMRLIKLES